MIVLRAAQRWNASCVVGCGMMTRSIWLPTSMSVVSLLIANCTSEIPGANDTGDPAAADLLPCVLEDITAQFAATTQWKDCGDLASSDSDLEFQRARECAEAALAHREPFRVVWHTQGSDLSTADAVLGIKIGDDYQISQFSSGDADLSAPAPKTVFRRCSGVAFVACELQGLGARLCALCAPPLQESECRCKLADDGSETISDCN